VPDRYCVKEVMECLDEVGKAKLAIFSTCNLTSGLWQQYLQEKSRQVPVEGDAVGIICLPASFAILMDFVMTGVKGIITYIDDILVHS
jgi:hypothetical protein